MAARDLQAGLEIGEEDLVAKVAETCGLSAQHLTTLIGRTLLVDINKDKVILEEHLL